MATGRILAIQLQLEETSDISHGQEALSLTELTFVESKKMEVGSVILKSVNEDWNDCGPTDDKELCKCNGFWFHYLSYLYGLKCPPSSTLFVEMVTPDRIASSSYGCSSLIAAR